MSAAAPYYDDGRVQLFLGDCLIERAWLEADALVTDPPYGQRYTSNAAKVGRSAPIAGDDSVALRDAALMLWGTKPALVFGTWRAPRPTRTKQLLVWDKTAGVGPGMGDTTSPWGTSHEELYVLGRGVEFVKPGKRSGSVIAVPGLAAADPARRGHPTPKPVKLMHHLIRHTTGVVADPFAGSGSTLVAARILGRRAIGVEIDEAYAETISKRLESLDGKIARLREQRCADREREAAA